MALYGWGAGNHGQLLNGLDDHSIPHRIELQARPHVIRGGGSHALFIIEQKLFAAGNNDEHQLGKGTNEAASDYPSLQAILNSADDIIVDVSCGWSHSLALTQRPQSVLGFGNNSFSQLALSSLIANTPSSIPLPLGITVTRVFCGLRHSGFLTETGELWLFGENRFGQAGVSSLEPVPVPTKLVLEEHLVSAALGARHTVCMTKDGRVFAFGENRFGQCGVNPSDLDTINNTVVNKPAKSTRGLVLRPVEVKLPVAPRETTILRCGWNYTLVWLPSGADDLISQHIFTFGRNNYGQLGIGTTSAFEWEVKTPIFPSEVVLKQIECGSEHAICLANDGSVWAYGWNEHGQLGLGDEKDRDAPKRVSSLDAAHIEAIATGYGFSFAW